MTPRRGLRAMATRVHPCVSSPSSRRRRSSGCGSATPSAAGCASPRHRDFSRAFERAVARARFPMAYSSGFHPHPRISYAGAAPTGAASEAEYLEIGLAQVVDPADVAAALAEALPDGLDVVTVVESPGGSLADRLTASRWTVQVPGVPDLAARVAGFLADRGGDRRADDEEGPAQLRLPLGRRHAAVDRRRGRRRARSRAAPHRAGGPSGRRARGARPGGGGGSGSRRGTRAAAHPPAAGPA